MRKGTAPSASPCERILEADPAELMVLFYDASLRLCRDAKQKIARQRCDDAHRLLVTAENVIRALSAAVRDDVFPDLADNVSRHSRFAFYSLLEANLSLNPCCIDRAVRVIAVLRDTWAEAVGAARRAVRRDRRSLDLSA